MNSGMSPSLSQWQNFCYAMYWEFIVELGENFGITFMNSTRQKFANLTFATAHAL